MYKIFCFTLLMLMLFACKPKQSVSTTDTDSEYLDLVLTDEGIDITEEIDKPLESYNYKERKVEQSSLNIPIQLEIAELETLINAQVDSALTANTPFEQDGLKVTAEKFSPIQLKLEGQRLKYLVPLKIDVLKETGLGDLKADGAIAMQLHTDFEIKEDWTLETSSEIDAHEWIEQPKLRFGLVSIPASFLVDLVIDESRAIITQAIDEQIKQLDTRKQMQEAWQKLHDPVLLSSEYNTWLEVNPQKISATPIKSTDEAIELIISFLSQPNVAIGMKPEKQEVPVLPPFKYEATDAKDFNIILSSAIAYQKAETLAKENVVGQTFEYEKYKIKIEDIELYGQDEKLVIGSKISGSYNGMIYFLGEPFYNESKNKVDIRNLDFSLSTKNFLLKTAGWVMKSNIRKQIRENVNFLLEENLAEARRQAKEQFERYELAPGVFLTSQLNDLGISDVYMTKAGLSVELGISGNLNIRLESLPDNTGK